MATVKTAISLPEALFKEIDDLARETNVSRSKLLAQAAEEYLERHRGQMLLKAINEAYADGLDPEEEEFLQATRRRVWDWMREDGYEW
ncbi:MAG TPA: ribbon-helix-helix protein, CopG family [Anaerolineae bacterium]|nr:ribbon-helix-helix protein, CopG family [Anaerolineae bacterium]